jgi:hypothetical protein
MQHKPLRNHLPSWLTSFHLSIALCCKATDIETQQYQTVTWPEA